MTLTEIQHELVDEIRTDCEVKLRDWVAARNAYAAIHYLLFHAGATIPIYKATLEFCKEQQQLNGVQTDHLQFIHICHNLLLCNQEYCSNSSSSSSSSLHCLSQTEVTEIEALKQTHIKAYLDIARNALTRVWEDDEHLFDVSIGIPYFITIIYRCCKHLDEHNMLLGATSVPQVTMVGNLNQNNRLAGKAMEEVVDACRKLQKRRYGVGKMAGEIPASKRSDFQELIRVGNHH